MIEIKTTSHFETRQNQRGINKEMIDIILAFGESYGDKIMLSQKQAIQLSQEIKFLLKSFKD
jgi:hypothetical protein